MASGARREPEVGYARFRPPLARVALIVLDGVGAGAAPDAAQYGDEGSNTLAHTARAVGGLQLPELEALGLGCVTAIDGVPPAAAPSTAMGHTLDAYLKDIETRQVRAALEEARWGIEGERGAARILGLHPNTLRSRIKKLGIRRPPSETS